MMKAAIRREYGGAENITIENITTPNPQDNQVLIQVKATTVNRTDCANLTGKPFVMRFFLGLFKPKKIMLGTDFAGTITGIGKNVKEFKIGDNVFGFNDQGICSQAEYLTFPENGSISLIPSNSNFEESVASLEAVHYAVNFINKVKLIEGQHVLINGASGGIGSALLQFSKYYNLNVTAVCDTKNIDRIKSLGADSTIDYLKEDFTKSKEKYDFVFDAVGKSTFSKCKPVLKEKGIYISSELGPNGQNLFLPLTTSLLGGKKVVFPIPSNIKASIKFVKELIEKNKFKAVIDKSYSLEEIKEAYKYVANGEKTGNVIIKF